MLEAFKVWLARFSRLPCSLNENPAGDKSYIALTEYAGTPIRGLSKRDSDVQLRFCAPSAHDEAWNVYRALVPVPPVVRTGGGSFIVRPKQSPFFLETDVLGRPVYVFNVAVIAAPD